jgi:hypothetical protein
MKAGKKESKLVGKEKTQQVNQDRDGNRLWKISHRKIARNSVFWEQRDRRWSVR